MESLNSVSGQLASQLDKTLRQNEYDESIAWRGPFVDGITYSMLSRFLQCRERFFQYAVMGWRPRREFSHRIEYGMMWHICEEAHSQGKSWIEALHCYEKEVCKTYPFGNHEEIHKWIGVCEIQYKIYLQWWENHQEDWSCGTTLWSEKVFDRYVKIPNTQHVVRLRGKIDRVFMDGDSRVGIQENKTKGEIKRGEIEKQLGFDLQTMLYTLAMDDTLKITNKNLSISEVLYNVVLRPLSGGKGTIVRHKPTKKNPNGETYQEYFNRLSSLIEEAHGVEWDEPAGVHHFFQRFRVNLSVKSKDNFRYQILNPILNNLCEWWTRISRCIEEQRLEDRFKSHLHWVQPYGIYNALIEGKTDYDELIGEGSQVGMEKRGGLFSELT